MDDWTQDENGYWVRPEGTVHPLLRQYPWLCDHPSNGKPTLLMRVVKYDRQTYYLMPRNQIVAHLGWDCDKITNASFIHIAGNASDGYGNPSCMLTAEDFYIIVDALKEQGCYVKTTCEVSWSLFNWHGGSQLLPFDIKHLRMQEIINAQTTLF